MRLLRSDFFIWRILLRRCNAIANTKEDEPRVNSEIRCPEVLLIDESNVKRGVVGIQEALKMAEAAELDLVEVAPQAKPPVCRIMNYGKYRFQQQKRDKDARKKQKNQVVKEIKMRPKIDLHDYEFKVKAIKAFLEDGHRVKVSIFFRGREMAFLDRGRDVLNKVLDAVSDYGNAHGGRLYAHHDSAGRGFAGEEAGAEKAAEARGGSAGRSSGAARSREAAEGQEERPA